jgi:protein gp37
MSSLNSGIEWTNNTWNPVRGCSRVSEGCRNCYAEKQAARIISCERGRGIPVGEGAYDGLLAAGGQWNGQVRLVPEALEQPKRWKKPRRIFVNSMADLFHENVPDEFISKVFEVMALCPQHTFQILTKRPERMLNYFTCLSLVGTPEPLFEAAAGRWPLPNVWIGVSVEDQKTADARIPVLLQVPAAIRWVSAEPLLGPLNLTELTLPSSYNITPTTPAKINCLSLDDDDRYYQSPSKLDWVVVGGESGKEARPMHPTWARRIRDQCAVAGTPFLFKQWGEWADRTNSEKNGSEEMIFTASGEVLGAGNKKGGTVAEDWRKRGGAWMCKVGKKAAGRMLDRTLHDAYPMETAK